MFSDYGLPILDTDDTVIDNRYDQAKMDVE